MGGLFKRLGVLAIAASLAGCALLEAVFGGGGPPARAAR